MFPAKFAVRRGAPIIGAAALAALTAACGTTASSAAKPAATGHGAAGATVVSTLPPTVPPVSAATVDPAPSTVPKLTGPAATALVNKAIANTKAVASVRVTGQTVADVAASGKQGKAQAVAFDMTLVKNGGCAGTMSVSATEAFRIVKTSGYVWLLPDSAFYSSLHLTPAAKAEVAGKYLKLPSAESEVGNLDTLCTLSGMLSALSKTAGKDFTASPVTYDGAPAYEVTEAGQTGIAYISSGAKPLLLRITHPQSAAGTLAFTEYDAVTSVTAPTGAESVTGSKIGL